MRADDRTAAGEGAGRGDDATPAARPAVPDEAPAKVTADVPVDVPVAALPADMPVAPPSADATEGVTPDAPPADAPPADATSGGVAEIASDTASGTAADSASPPASDVAPAATTPDSPVTAPAPEPASPPAEPPVPTVVDVEDLDWAAVGAAVDPSAARGRIRATVERMEALLDQDGGPGLLFDTSRAGADDRVIHVTELDAAAALWFVGDLHGDLLALEAALALVAREGAAEGGAPPRIVFLGDLFDDGAYGLEVLLRVFELVSAAPDRVCVIAGNHDEALSYDGARFASAVSPSDFSEFLDARLTHEWVVRAGKLAVRLFANAPRALFLPDGLLVAHGGVPLVDLHPMLRATRNWNDPRCLTDFVWTRAHPKARKKLPNRSSRGSQYGYEDFAAFCALSAELGRPVSRMVRGHDHVDDRWAVYPAYAAHPLLTTVALSRRLPREMFGPYERVPTVARWVPGSLPQVHRLHVPPALVRYVFPEAAAAEEGDA